MSKISKINMLLCSLLLLVGVTLPVAAAEPGLDFEVPQTVIRDVPGSTHSLHNASVPGDLRGKTCDVTIKGVNNTSIHADNTVSVNSATTFSWTGYEDSGNPGSKSGQITLDDSVNLSVTLSATANNENPSGPHAGKSVTSAGFKVTFDCPEDVPEPIEVCRDGKVITINPDERLDTDTNPPCPEEQIEVCRDGKVITIDKDDRRQTDTNPPCPEGDEKIKICRDGEMITIDADDRRDSDTDACVLAEEDLPTQLPVTGPGSLVAGFLGSSALFASVRYWLDSRRMLGNSLLNKTQ